MLSYNLIIAYKSMKESVNEFIVYNKFVTGPLINYSLTLSKHFFMETRATFILPESNDNLTRTIAALPESISSEGMIIFKTSVSSTSQIYSVSAQ